MNMNMNNESLVSIIIPTCDRGELFHKSVSSAINQTYSNIEIIIIDDNSQSPVDITHFKTDKSLKVFRNSKNLGGAISRNKGFELSSGEFICFLDDDDEYLPNKIEDLVRELQFDGNIDAVFGRIIKKSDPERKLPEGILEKGFLLKSLKTIGYLHTNTSLIRRETFEKIKFDERLEKFQDTQLHIELIKKFKCKYVEIDVATWNDQHGLNQITDMKTKEQFLKSIESYSMLIASLRNSNSLSFYNNIYMNIKLNYLKGRYFDKFGKDSSMNVTKVSYAFYLIKNIFS